MISKIIWSRPYLMTILAVTLLLATSCVTGSSSSTNGKPELSYKQKYEILSKEYRSLRQEYDKISKKSGYRDMESRVNTLNKRLLEKDSEIERLAQRMAEQQKKLDDAIQEVVRAKAKLRSLESRAETATTIAETEIALKALRIQHPDRETSPEMIQAEQLLAMSSQEFQKENYGGALYLVNQAKDQIKNAQSPDRDKKTGKTLLGEVPFAKPLNLRVTKKSNLREGPGRYYKVVAIVRPSTPLTGYSFKGQWLRVKGTNGLGGWIFQDLVKGRQ